MLILLWLSLTNMKKDIATVDQFYARVNESLPGAYTIATAPYIKGNN